jgi:hypothetical protein
MTAEQFADAVSSLTGVWPKASADMVKTDGRGQGGQVKAVRAAIAAVDGDDSTGGPDRPGSETQWIWSHADAVHDPGGRILLRKVIQLDSVPEQAVAVATCDNELVLYVNGKRVAKGESWSEPVSVDITKLLKRGENVVAAEATNWPDPDHQRGVDVKGANPAGFTAWVGGFRKGRVVWSVGTDASWLWTRSARGNWKTQPYDTSDWQHAAELADAGKIYGDLNLARAVEEQAPSDAGKPIRAALAFDDPLLSAMGRTHREQVVTRRDSVATMLQALELTNGVTLDSKLKQGAAVWVKRHGKSPRELVRRIYIAAFGRAPTHQELATAEELVGSPATREGVEDLLWVVTMLPEFQLIE